jgi:hypothetical protein
MPECITVHHCPGDQGHLLFPTSFTEVDLRVFPESMHGFTSYPTAMAKAALDGVERWLAGRLDDQ